MQTTPCYEAVCFEMLIMFTGLSFTLVTKLRFVLRVLPACILMLSAHVFVCARAGSRKTIGSIHKTPHCGN